MNPERHGSVVRVRPEHFEEMEEVFHLD